MFNVQSRKEYINPYRTGVLIGNYSEDIFGKDLAIKYNKEPHYSNYITEKADKYRNPQLIFNKNVNPIYERDLQPNYDLKIDFTKTTIKELREDLAKKDIEKEEFLNKLKNQSNFDTKENLSLNQVNSIDSQVNKKKCDSIVKNQRDAVLSRLSGYSKPLNDNIKEQLEGFVKKDLIGLYYTKESGLNNSLLKGHGPFQNKFDYNEYISVKNLTIDNKEKTDKILDPHYIAKDKFTFPSKFEPKDKEPHIKRYKKYGEFTKEYDKITHKG